MNCNWILCWLFLTCVQFCGIRCWSCGSCCGVKNVGNIYIPIYIFVAHTLQIKFCLLIFVLFLFVLWMHIALCAHGTQRLAIYYTTGNGWEINSLSHQIQNIQVFKCCSIIILTIQARWLDGDFDHDGMRGVSAQTSKWAKRLFTDWGPLSCVKDAAEEIRPRLHGRGLDGSCSEEWLSFVHPLLYLYPPPLICPGFKAHTRGATRILPGPLSYPISWQLKYFIYLLYQMHLLEIVGKLIELYRYHIWK